MKIAAMSCLFSSAILLVGSPAAKKMGVRGVLNSASCTWLLPCLLVASLFGCSTRDDRVVARAKALALAGKTSESLRLLTNYLVQHPHSTEPRRAKILLAIEGERSEEALADHAAITASQAKEDTALLHMLALGLIRDSWQSNEGFLRARAAAALGSLLEPPVQRVLERRLRDLDPYVRLYSAEALAKIGAPSAVSYLQAALAQQDRFLRLFAGELLSNLGDRSAIPFLRETLQSDGDIPTRLYAAWTLGRLGDHSGLASVTEILKNPDPNLRANAAWTLGEIGGEEAVALLKGALRDGASAVKMHAVWALDRIARSQAKAPAPSNVSKLSWQAGSEVRGLG